MGVGDELEWKTGKGLDHHGSCKGVWNNTELLAECSSDWAI